MPTLQSCVGDVERFERLHWGRLPVIYQESGLDIAQLLTVGDVDTIVNSALRWPAVRVVRSGTTTPPNDYCTPTRIGSSTIDLVADPHKVLDQYRRGSTIVLQSLHRTWLPMSAFACALESEISHTVQANAYLTPPDAVALAPHADGHDVLVVQLHGEKNWSVDGLDPLRLRPGHVLYLPRGTTHSACTAGTASLHLTVGIHPTTVMTIARRALASVAESGRAQSLPLGYAALGRAQLTEIVARALAESSEGIAAFEPDSLVESLRQVRPRRDQSGAFARAVLRTTVTPASVVRLAAPSATTQQLEADGRVLLNSPHNTLHLPATARASIERLIDSGSTKVSDLPGLDSASQLVLARRLLDEGVALLVTQ